ncbi:hypothetical protein NIES970_12750 [[Synechococcus] sp. NIES-970]|uniref:hypothetical protein n=1 Tax=Picosynechococcus sp. NKBG15041c TaxID=1407650 RepID=UPI000427927A|nr:hypothetical protein [Picosynechococcus sp. NKBG15041c]BAW96349.1 hypothetical protein NIES970_12750 [[Synechococcus] sp. NIES-970]
MGDRRPQELTTDNSLSPLARKLARLNVLGRWLFVVMLWLTLGNYGFWALREEFPLWQEYLTWAVIRLSLGYHYWASAALTLCVAYTCAILVWHSQKLLRGWSDRECYRLNRWAERLDQNKRHWLWRVLKYF